ncbi:MAG: tRNA-(ms[2]io[6]A)-hydroxylase [Pleurocapsa sp. SU_5_0]|nr:tRNA-(ms[2]io[6]A)-hydroxylase [Pleurocapsa sp. SU_5_0]NJO96683.1 tRNA-(ms[2]io[6]A)-hydroxylase [Pleurocapsa sp. CRU_1_2]NJR47852.1 tRNA-(ms[2]io[6]A)-hydroxylase [Hyellaceae cyanobacterium CSU_1_1]
MINRVVAGSTTATIKILQQPSNPNWIETAIANLDTILLDHSHCERKAAGAAINLMFRYPAHQKLVRQLTAIAQEELSHFDQVNQWLEKRNITLAALNSPPYFAQLKSQVRHLEPDRLIDLLLVSAIIEARSHERLGLIGEYCPDAELAKFYRSLMASEARHYGSYWLLAEEYSDRPTVERRLAELGEYESSILATMHPEPRLHS